MSLEGNASANLTSLGGKIHSLVIDKTLSVSGACADAKATGDRMDTFDDKIDQANKSVEEAREYYEEAVAGMDKAAAEAAKKAVEALTAADVGAYTKEEVLSELVKEMYGLNSAATPNTVFMALKMPAGYYGFAVTAKFSDGTPAAGLELKGLLSFEGYVAKTNADGFCYAMTQDSTPTVDFTNYIGIVSKTETLQAVEGEAYTAVEITVEKDTAMRRIDASVEMQSYKDAVIDFCAVGGGGGAANCEASVTSASGGGGGGYVTNVFDIPGGDNFTISIGVGGSASIDYGGTTTVKKGSETIASADGGQSGRNGGSGDGNGRGGFTRTDTGTKAVSGSVRVFNDDSLPLPGGGGGASAEGYRTGGSDFGGYGAEGGTAGDGTGPGGGGGGAKYANGKAGVGGKGHAGAVYLRARYV